MSDHDIEDLLKSAAQAEDRTVPDALMARVLADAKRLQPQPGAPLPGQSTAAVGALGWLSGALDVVGGWMGPAAVAASLCLGIGLGMVDPTATGMPDFAALLTQSSTTEVVDTDGLDALGLGQFDLSSIEW